MNNRIDDFEIIGRDHNHVTVRCLVCGRIQVLSSLYAFTKRNNKHGNICSKIIIKEHGGSSKTLRQFYSIWCNMRTRTTNKNSAKWKDYGGRGISSYEFQYFVDFYDLMYEDYIKHVEVYGENETTLERIDVNGNYCKENCTFVTWKEQANNRRNLLRFIAIRSSQKYYGKNLKKFCESYNINYDTILRGLYKYGCVHYKDWFIEKCNDYSFMEVGER